MSNEDEQVEQRRANLEAITKLGVRPYPHRFATDAHHQCTGRGARHPQQGGARGYAGRDHCAGRILSIRSFGKASFFVLSDGRSRIQVYVRQDALSERDFALSKLLDYGDHIGVAGHLFRTKTNELSIWAIAPGVSGQVLHPAAGEVARTAGCRDSLPPALSRSRRQPRCASRVRGAQPDDYRDPGFPGRPRVSRSRDADDAADRGRGARAAVRDASQRARHEALPARSRRSSISSGSWSAASRRCSRSIATSGTRASAIAGTPSSRCSSSIGRTPITTT